MPKQNKWADVRETTYQNRLEIGFDNLKKNWSNSPAIFNENSLKICNHPVMEAWEDDYMKTLAKIATLNSGNVLEVGFGMGISANYIQDHEIDLHIIIEANQDVYQQLLKFSETATSKVKPLFGFWEETINQIKDNSISGILFDTYPLEANEVHRNHFNFFQQAHRILKKGGILTYYSDEIRDFSQLHIQTLKKAGFKQITGKICNVTPPSDCEYWKSKTILAPIIVK